LLITIVGLVVGRGWGMVSWGMVNNSMVNRGMVNNWCMMNSMMGNWVGKNRGNNSCMMNSRSMMDCVTTESCERNSWPTSHKGDKSN